MWYNKLNKKKEREYFHAFKTIFRFIEIFIFRTIAASRKGTPKKKIQHLTKNMFSEFLRHVPIDNFVANVLDFEYIEKPKNEFVAEC